MSEQKEEREDVDVEDRATDAPPDQSEKEEPKPPSWDPAPIVSPKIAYALSALTGLLYVGAFPGSDMWPLIFFAYVPWLYALRGQSAKQALKMSWLMGFIGVAFGFYWVVEMLQVFSGFPLPACIFFAGVLNLYQSGRMALTGWLYGRATERGWPHAPVFVAAFLAGELVFPLLFPWYAAACVHQVPILIQIADLGGPLAVSGMLLGSNLALAELCELLVAKWSGRGAPRRPLSRATIAVGFALPLVALVYGKVRMDAIDRKVAAAEKLTIGMVQPMNDLFHRRDALQVHFDMTKVLRDQGVDLVVWSEGAIAKSFPEQQHERAVKQAVTSKLGVPTIVGAVLFKRADPRSKGRKREAFNVALMADEKGNIVGRYDKQFLLMFGEYLPLGDTFPILYQWSPHSGQFSPGKSFAPLEWRGHRISTMICYEDILPSFVNELVSAGDPDLFVNMTNDTWFGNTTEPWIHLALAKFRSVEHRLFLVRVTNSGVSAIVDPNGRVVVHGGVFTRENIIGEAAFLRERTVYSKIRDVPWWIATVLVVAGAFFAHPRRQRRSS